MLTIFQQIAQVLSINSSVVAKLDALAAKVNTLAADVAAIKAGGGSGSGGSEEGAKLEQIRQILSDTQAAVINIQAALGSPGN